MQNPKDAEILDLYWARDERALTESQKTYGAYCHSIAWHILYDREDADECVNDTWFRAWNALPPGKPDRLGLFLGTITRNLSLDRWKRQRRGKRGGGVVPVALDELAECIPDSRDTESIVEAARLQRLVDAFLHTLSERDCNVFLRRYWYAEEYGEIAKRYGLRLNTVKTILFRTRGRLKAYLQKEGVVL